MPTPEEIEEAKQNIEMARDPQKQLASCMQSFKTWCMGTGNNAANAQRLAATGDLRKKFMYDYIVMMNRQKKAKLAAYSSRMFESMETTNKEKGWMGLPIHGRPGRSQALACLVR